ncbi:MAG: phosphopantetheine-binding protein [Gammaproteobacteria bacterium]
MKLDHSAIVEELIRLLEAALGRRQAMSADTALIADLGLESIQVIEYLCEVEDRFDLAIDEDTLADVQTVGDLAAVVQRLLNG